MHEACCTTTSSVSAGYSRRDSTGQGKDQHGCLGYARRRDACASSGHLSEAEAIRTLSGLPKVGYSRDLSVSTDQETG